MGRTVVFHWVALSAIPAFLQIEAADPACGGRVCEEAVLCSSAGVLECSDWNDLSLDAWSVSPSGLVGIQPGAGLNGTPGWHMQVPAGGHGSKFFDKALDPNAAGFGPLHARFYVKFSPGFVFRQPCGLNKMFYLQHANSNAPFWRIMLGIREAGRLGGSYANLPDTVGIFGFDYIGHFPAGGAVPNRAEDTPVLIYPDKWYCVEIMAHWKSRSENTVKIWVDGTLQMTRSNFDDGVWTTAHRFDSIQDSSYFGGSGAACAAPQTQSIYKDNHVIATRYIGPIGGLVEPPPPPPPPPLPDTTPPAAPANLSASATFPFEITLSWAAAADNVGVTGYRVFRGGVQVGATSATSYKDTGLDPSTAYTYAVSALDAAGNVGPRSAPASATTLPSPPLPGDNELILPPAQETFIKTDSSSNAGSATLNAYTWPDNQVANAILMKFDLSSLPPGSQVEEAILTLFLLESDLSTDPTYGITVHKVINKDPDLDRANGATYDGVNAWTPSSCCFGNFPLAQADISTPYDTLQVDKIAGFKSWRITAMAQEWAGRPAENFGLLLNSDATRLKDRWRFFAGSPHPTPEVRPFLKVTYKKAPDTVPPAPPRRLRAR